MFPTYSPQGCGVQPRGLVPNFLLRLKSFCVASPWARLTEVLCWLSIRVTPIGKAREISPYVGQTLAWPTVHLKKLLVLCRRRVRKGSWCRDLTLASRLSAQLIWARCTGACFLPVRSPCAPRMHFWACLEICDHQLSRSRETKYTGEKNKIKQINKKNPTPPPPPTPSKRILCSKIYLCPWENKLVRSITISAGSSLQSASAYPQNCLLLSSFHPLKARRASKWLQGLCSWCTHHRSRFTFGCPAMPGELPAYRCWFGLTGIKGCLLLSRALQDPMRNCVLPPQINMQK